MTCFTSFVPSGSALVFKAQNSFDQAEVCVLIGGLGFCATSKMIAATNDFYSAMANFTLPVSTGYNAGESVIVDNKGKVIAKHPSKEEDGIIEATIPIGAFRKGRKIPNYAYEMVKPVFNQYRQEIPINHLDMPTEKLPKTGQEMKILFDTLSRFITPLTEGEK